MNVEADSTSESVESESEKKVKVSRVEEIYQRGLESLDRFYQDAPKKTARSCADISDGEYRRLPSIPRKVLE